ncbi:c-binding -like isoform X2, partial [Brachionus plicatilis]
KHVCGLCGNGDGLVSNDFVDKANSLVNSDGKFFNRSIFLWANKWRVPDDSIDSDKASCNTNSDPGPEPEPVKCKNETVYRNYEWCGVIRNYQGPWAECLLKIDPVLLEGIYEGCLFDLCASEENKTLQNEYRCKAYEQITSVCSGLLGSLINWRIKVNCPADCGPNEIYDLRKECPRTCIDQLGDNDCGELNYAEGCFCKDSYVRNSFGQCIDLQECGCILPGGSVDLSYGEIFQPNCSVRFVCDGLSGQLNVEYLRSCSTNAVCLADQNNEPNCVCIQGFVGDGFICERETTQVIPTTSENFEFSLLDLEFTDQLTIITASETQNTKSNENTYSTTKIPCFEDMVIYRNENQFNFSDTFVNGTSRCGLSNDPFYFEELLDLEFSECEAGSVCYGFGDPHYRTFDGDKFSVNKT